MGVSKESISKFLIGNRFHVKLRILSPIVPLSSKGKQGEKTVKEREISLDLLSTCLLLMELTF